MKSNTKYNRTQFGNAKLSKNKFLKKWGRNKKKKDGNPYFVELQFNMHSYNNIIYKLIKLF